MTESVTLPPSPALDLRACFEVDPSSVFADDLDGEIVLLHLGSGNYFSLAGSGAQVWRLIASGASAGTILEAFASATPAEPAALRDGAERFLAELVAEGLVAVSTTADAASLAADAARTAVATVPAGSLSEAPALLKYTDMQDLLLLDPIHEVDESGWPARRDPGTDN